MPSQFMPTEPRPCKRCCAEIPSERLEAVPGTELCVKCSAEVGGEWEYMAIEENLAKAGSLKKNYGGVTIHKRRKRSR
jgi:hypothetical protein